MRGFRSWGFDAWRTQRWAGGRLGRWAVGLAVPTLRVEKSETWELELSDTAL